MTCKWLITMVSFRPLTGVVPLPNGLFIEVTNYLLTEVILQVPQTDQLSSSISRSHLRRHSSKRPRFTSGQMYGAPAGTLNQIVPTCRRPGPG